MNNNAWVEVLQGRILIVLVVIVVILGAMAFTHHAREITRAARETGLEILPLTIKGILAEGVLQRL